jgi:PAS domain S-box-containing protein
LVSSEPELQAEAESKQRLRVLIVEDSADDAFLLQRTLEQGGYVLYCKRVCTGADLRATLKKEPWDLIVCDYIMPGFGGLEALEIVRKSGLDLPFLVISGKISQETAVKAMKAGAHDYIMKDQMARLVPSVRRELAEARVRAERRQTTEDLRISEENYRHLANSIADIFFAVDWELHLRFLNSASEKFLGVSLKEAIGKSLFDILPELKKDGHEPIFRKALKGRPQEFEWDLLLNGQTSSFQFSIYPSDRGLTILAKDVTQRKRIEQDLKMTTEQLKIEREALERKNIALREVLDQIENEKDNLRQRILTNVERSILPLLSRLSESAPAFQSRNFQILETDLREIVSPFLDHLENRFSQLTPRELEVCRLINQGLTSKEIAEALHLSPATILKYRELIRKKMGLVGTDTNLSTFLHNLIK